MTFPKLKCFVENKSGKVEINLLYHHVSSGRNTDIKMLCD